jgi:hypothetical protein
MMDDARVLESSEPRNIEAINLTSLYLQYVTERKTLNIKRIREFIDWEDCIVCIDNVHGATRGRIQSIIGKNDKVRYLRTSDDYLFGGVAPEPSPNNMQGVEKLLLNHHQTTCRELKRFSMKARPTFGSGSSWTPMETGYGMQIIKCRFP